MPEQCPAAENPPGRQGDAAGLNVRSISVLDSSFNPPTAAHAALARASLQRLHSAGHGPAALLLLLATSNADKPPAPAPLAHRLAMMARFARHLRRGFDDEAAHAADSCAPAAIDVGLTTAARYADKRAAVAADASGAYRPARGPPPEQAYVVGYDTLERVLAPRYYPGHDPPLSALAGFFGSGAWLQVVLRPAAAGGGGEERQRRAVRDLASGALAAEGFRAEWAAQVDVLEPEGGDGSGKAEDVAGVSSTRARAAARDGKSDELGRLVCPAVADWIREYELYQVL